LEPLALAVQVGRRLRLTDRGLERSDVIGPWLYSDAARGLMEGFTLR
jgi:oxygen-independent coproporphyrinogen-3 oxidase